MTYRIFYHKGIEKELDRIPTHIIQKIQDRIEQLKQDPFATPHVKKLIGREGYRLRVGDYRLLFEADTRQKIIRIRAIRHRREVYRF